MVKNKIIFQWFPCDCGRRLFQIPYPPLHWIHAQLVKQPTGLGGRGHGQRDVRPHLPGDGVPPPLALLPPAPQRRPRQARRVCHALRHWRQVHVCRPAVSGSASLGAACRLAYTCHWRIFLSMHGSTEKSKAVVCWCVEIMISLCRCFSEGAVHLDGIMWHSIFLGSNFIPQVHWNHFNTI